MATTGELFVRQLTVLCLLAGIMACSEGDPTEPTAGYRWLTIALSVGSNPLTTVATAVQKSTPALFGIVGGATEYIVNTIAGSGPPDVGDGGTATSAILESPGGVVVARDGTLYVVDTYNNRIRHLKDGVIRTIAGNGSSEDRTLGDGLLATEGVLRIPRDLAIAPDGTLYIADSNHYLIRRVDAAGIMTTYAGNRQPRYAGDGGPAKDASFSFPVAVAIDDLGTVYVADQLVHRVRRIRSDGVIETIAGNGQQGSDGDGGLASQARIDTPTSLAIRNRTQLLIAGSGPLRSVDLVSGVISTVSSVIASHVAVDGDRGLLLADGPQVLRLNLANGQVSRIAGSGAPGFSGDGDRADRSQVGDVKGLAADARGTVYFADSANQRIRRIGLDGIVQTVVGSGHLPGDSTTAAASVIYDGQGITTDTRGNLYFSDFLHNTIRRLAPDGQVTTVAGNRRATWAGDGGHPLSASFSAPRGLQFDRDGQLLFIDETRGVGVVRAIMPGADGIINGSADERIITVAGRVADRSQADHGAADGRPAIEAVFAAARGFAVDSHNNLYIADWLDHRIRRVTPGADGILNRGRDEVITTIAGTGAMPSTGDGGLAVQATVSAPNWISVSPLDDLFVFEETNDDRRAVRHIDAATGKISTVLRSKEIWSMAAPTASELYFANGTQLSRLNLRDNTAAVIAGQASAGFNGDGGDARQAQFRGAGYFTIEGNGSIYLIDNGNFRIRKLSRP